MAGMDVAALTAPVSADDPCGPDLDLEGDPDYFNFLARVEGLLPASFFSGPEGRPFDRAAVDFAAEFTNAEPLLERTRDLRLLTLLARLYILNRDLAGFRTCVEAVAGLTQERWDEVHPRGEGGDYMLRMTAIETLDDMPTVILPMQFLPLVNHRRHGQISYRAYMVAAGEARAREDEEVLDLPTIDRALMEVDLPPLVEVLQQFDAVQQALTRLRAIWIDRAGFEQAVNLDKSVQFAGRIATLLNGIVAKRDPSAALATVATEAAPDTAEAPAGAAMEAAAPVMVGEITSRDDVSAALAAAAGYFSRAEPSNPALLLVRQAQQLVGCSFIDAMRILMPAHVEQAAIAVGAAQVFDLPVQQLSGLAPDAAELAAGGGAAAAGDDGTAAVEDGAAGVAVAEATDETPARTRVMKAETRQQALALLDQVGRYCRAAEPTSPVPVMTERARRVAERDFMSLLKDFLPAEALKAAPPET